jgi:filamentous hemagglutinin family protein
MLNPRVLRQLCHQFDINQAISLRREKVSEVLREKNEERLGNWERRFWHLGIVLALGVSSAILGRSDRALAQSNIVPDSTLGAESSGVVPLDPVGLPIDVIDGGAIRGTNLFHSFREFNVAVQRGAYFRNPSDSIQNILARVTGSNRSEILGTLGVLNATGINTRPNLFLINPNGIIFGENSSLDVGGSFVATTANAVRLGNTGLFSASAPALSNLLSVKPSAFFFNALSNQAIVNRSRATSTVLDTPTLGLMVPDGQSLLLIGGDVKLDGGIVHAPGGRVELGGLAGAGTIGLSMDGNNPRLSFPNDFMRADVSLTNGAVVKVSAGSGGNFVVNARNLEILEGSVVIAGLDAGLGSVGSQAGDIILNATEGITIANSSIRNQVDSGATGKGGAIDIQARSFSLTDSVVRSITRGQGDAGNLNVQTTNFVSVDRNSELSTVTVGEGTAGNLTIATGRLAVQNGGAISAVTASAGNAGNLTVRAPKVELIGTSVDGLQGSGLFTQTQGAGNAGNLTIETGQLIVQNGAQVIADVAPNSIGRGGTMIITASDSVEVIGATDKFPSSLNVDTRGTGEAGNLRIETRRLIVKDGAQVSAATIGLGNGGSLTIRANEVEVVGRTADGQFPSLLTTQTGGFAFQSLGDRPAGNLTIETDRLTVRDGAGVSASSLGAGQGGTLRVIASDSVELLGAGASLDGLQSSKLSADAHSTGAAGQLTIRTGKLIVRDGAQVGAGTFGTGRGGNLDVIATQSVELSGISTEGTPSGLFTSTEGVGDAGNLSIISGQLDVRDGATVNVSSQGTGKAGDLQVQARLIQLDNIGRLIAQSKSGQGGNITLNVQDLLLLRYNSEISTTAGTAQKGGDGGNITINSPFIVAVPKENSDITANAYTGKGGNINITTQGIYGLQFRPNRTPLSDITASSDFGVNGTVQINSAFDVTQSVTNLPIELVDASNQIDQTCSPSGAAAREGNRFVITGRGGLPPSPNEPLQDESVVTHWVTLNSQAEHPTEEATSAKPASSAPNTGVMPAKPTLIEAQGWRYGANGEVILTASTQTATPQSPSTKPAVCRLK